jgi:hypothetical protein
MRHLAGIANVARAMPKRHFEKAQGAKKTSKAPKERAQSA